MALDVHVAASLDPEELGAPLLQIEDGGMFWALHPFLARVPTRTGEPIDLYGAGTYLDGALIPHLQSVLAEAHSHFKHGPDPIRVLVGRQLKPVERELVEEVSRLALLELVRALGTLAARAVRERALLVFVGD